MWEPCETTTHQDHVIAHVVGASVLGYFVFDEALYILLDIGFLWGILLDGQMSLLPHPVAVSELDVDEQFRSQIKADLDLLLSDTGSPAGLLQFIRPPVESQIKDVSFFEREGQRRLIITGEEANLAIETSLTTAEIQVHEC